MQQYHFELLKKSVSESASIPNVTASDCKHLSNLIFKKTNRCLSETTLKRIYGLVQTKHNPSQFTIEALSKYCGFANLEEFLKSCDYTTSAAASTNWNKMATDAHKVTNFVIKGLKNRSGIPFKHTIGRKSVSFHLDTFIESDAVATALVAPSGFGKTTALLHWIEDKLELNASQKSNDIFLFFSSQVLMSIVHGGQNIHCWLLSLLGCSNTEYHSLIHNAGEKRFYLIIDGFDEIKFKNPLFQLVLDQLIDILNLYHESRSFKLILTTLPNTWINNRNKLGFIRKKWFDGFTIDPENAINIPMLNAYEISEISRLVNPKNGLKIDADVVETLCHPMYFELYYKLSNQNCHWKKIDHLLRYELTSNLIFEKIHLNKIGIKTTQFLYELIGLMDLKDENNPVGRLATSTLIVKNEEVYQTLLNLHLLKTINKSTPLQQNIHIEFCSKDILNYFIAQRLLSLNDGKFNESIINYVNECLTDELRLSVVKWLIWNIVNTDEKNELHNLTLVRFPLNLKANLLTFLCQILEYEYVSLSVDGTDMRKFHIQNSLLDYFLGIEFINANYSKTLTTLLRFDLSPDRCFLLHCYKAITAIVNLNLETLQQQIEELKELPSAIVLSYPINPINCFAAIFNFLKYGIVNKVVLAQITTFSFNPVVLAYNNYDEAANNMVGLLMASTLIMGQNPQKLLRVVSILSKSYKASPVSSIAYPFILKMLFADAYFALNKQRKLSEIQEDISKIISGKQTTTPYMEVLVHILKIKIAIGKNEHETITNEFRIIMLLANNHNLKLIKLYTTSLLLKKYTSIDDPQFIRFYQEINYEHTKVVRENQVVEFWEKQIL
ncbi:hypothetical protein [Mucilaginibacter dorajii]|uniref:NACHT domain-containing protein n=1 Tax=Mucilaginibacter dorajii TaxID=692994 RepID=A0ABP7P5N0_9SPHI|nr:hypothetical protein [Mucilaginibacter dorajii]MCS3734450.1 hypothetical protein [Mucilaginibacter dorajii]